MTAKQYLSQARKLEEKIKQKQQMLAEMEANVLSGGCLKIKEDKIQSSIDGNRLEDSIIKCADLAEEIASDIERYMRQKNEIVETIHQLDDVKYIKVIYYRWIQNKKFEEIAVETNYYFSTVRKIYWQGMKKIQAIIDKKYSNI